MTLRERAEHLLEELEQRNLRRRPRTVAGSQSTRVQVDGREVLSFCSNNYLGLADAPELLAAARASLEHDGLGAGASRLVSGSMTAHLEAEVALAGFVGAESAILFATGYAANLGSLSALAGPGDVLFSDASNHASLIDGCRLSRAKVVVYPHRDLEALERLLRTERGERAAFVVTDSVFSMDGDEADLPALRRLADQYDAALILDEAHALGVLGPAGRGLAAERGVVPDLLLGALGKAFGQSGGFAAGSAPVIELLRNRARSYVFSTAPLPLVARTATAAVALVAAADDRRARLHAAAAWLRGGLRDAGYLIPDGRTPILPVIVGAERTALDLSRHLLDRGVFAQAIRPPTVPRETSRIRLVPIATHTDADLEHVLDAFRTAPAELRGTR